MLKKTLLALLILAAGFAVVVALQPSDFRVSRSAKMAAPPETVFAQVNDFHQWQAWSPWAKLDPNAQFSYSGPASGPGAVFRWAGNNEVGEGAMTILESKPGERILIQLDFLKPMAGTSTAEFTFRPEAGQTSVTWSMFGKNNFIAKAMGLFMNCDEMIGGQFEKGLAQMKSVVEAAPK